jgi:MFS family permease
VSPAGSTRLGIFKTSRSLEERNVRVLTIDTAIQGLIQAGIAAFVSVYLVRLGAPNAVVGFLTSAPALGAIFLSVPAASRLEGHPNLVRVVVIWRFLLRLCTLAIALIPFFLTGDVEMWAIVALWTLTSVPAAIVNPAWTAVVAAIVPPRRRPSVNGTRWALLSVVTAAGGAAFGRTLDLIVTPLNFQIVFFISFLAGMVTLYTFSLIRMPPKPASEVPSTLKPPGAALSLGDIIQVIREYPPFTQFLWTGFIYRIGLNLPVALFSIYWVREAHASNTIIGIQSTVANLALVGSYLFWGRLAVRKGHRIVLLLSSAGTGLYPLATGLVRDEIWLIPVALIWGAFASGIDVSFFEALLRSAPQERLQTFVAINSSLANFVIFVAPLAGTLLADAIGIHVALFLAAAISLLGTFLFYTFHIAREAAPGPTGRPERALA